MGVLHTFAKKSKWAPASISSVDVKRVLREVNRRASKKYRLEHVRGHQDRMKSIRDLPLKAPLNVEKISWAKGQ